MTRDARRVGETLAASAPDLARLWRARRTVARPEVFPGLADGLMEAFFARAGEALEAARDPALVWPATDGALRVVARDRRRTREELEAEWDVAEEVLQAACRALDATEGVDEWISRAVVIARAGARTASTRGARRGILKVRLYSDPAATRRARAPSRR